MKRILFVDDEPYVLDALKRTLNSMNREWDMGFASCGAEALRMMAEKPVDVVVSDMRMPQMNGAQLLNEVLRLHPRTVRLILSGYSDHDMVMQCIGGTHQFLSKPCTSEMLRSVIARALEIGAWLNNDDLKAIVSRLEKLPSKPDLYFEIVRHLDSPKAAIEDVGRIIAQDPGMTAKVLQLVNSAFFGLCRHFTDPTEVVAHLGMETIKSLVMGIHIFTEYETSNKGGITAQELWEHSLMTANLSRRIANLEHLTAAEDAFTAGLLHDVGRLVLLTNRPEDYARVVQRNRKDGVLLEEAEREIFGAAHAEVGAYLLGLWGLPASLVETALFHHCPGKCPNQSFGPLSIVHAANVLTREVCHREKDAKPPALDLEYLARIGMSERLPLWRVIAGEENFGNQSDEKNIIC